MNQEDNQLYHDSRFADTYANSIYNEIQDLDYTELSNHAKITLDLVNSVCTSNLSLEEIATEYQIELSDPTDAALYHAAQRVLDRWRGIPDWDEDGKGLD